MRARLLPGTIGLTGPLFASINEQVSEQMIKNGFRNIVLMGDHGGGQKELADVARKLTEKYRGQGVKVVFCDAVYAEGERRFRQMACGESLSREFARGDSGHVGDVVSGRGQGLDAKRGDRQRIGRSGPQTR